MKHYYKAKARDGAVTSGELEAGSQAEARRMLREQGLFALEVSAAGRRPAGAGKPSRSLFAQRVGKGDVLLMLSQLNIMCQSGVDLAEALRGIASQSQNPRLKETLEKVHYDVTSGQTFSESLGKHKDIFDESLVAGIAAGEQSGAISQVLDRLTHLLRTEIRLRSAVWGLMSYPAVLCLVTFVVLNALVFFILPQFAKVFAELGRPAPPLTQALLNSGEFFRGHWVIIVSLAGGAALLAYRAFRHQSTRRWWDRACLNQRGIRGPMRALLAGRTFRLLGTMLMSGVPLLDSIRLCRGAQRNQMFRDLFDRIESDVINGKGLSGSLVAASFLPLGAAQMISTAEHTGKLGQVLQTVGEYFEDDGERHLRDVVKMLEPAIIIALGVVVMFVVLSVILPLLDVSSVPH